MISVKRVLLIILFVFSNYTLIFSQTSRRIYTPKSTVETSTPYLPHASVTNGQQGFSFAYSYPGFFSYWGQASMYYTNSFGDSYFGSVGEVYIMVGVNKKIIKISKSIIYLNANIGIIPDDFGYLGSFGFSLLQQLTPQIRIELVFDTYINHGFEGDWMVHDKIYSKGFWVGINFPFNITSNLLVNFGVGLSSVKYRYRYMPDTAYHNSKGEYRYEYITNKLANYIADNNLYWDSKYLIPFGITLSYHF